jgi:hypothetical protein
MPLHWTISHPNRLVIAVVKGQCSRVDVEDYIDGVGAVKAHGYRKIFDVTRAEPLALTPLDISVLASRVRQIGRENQLGAIAIVATSAENHALAELFATEAIANRPISVFKELHEARHWLDSFD